MSASPLARVAPAVALLTGVKSAPLTEAASEARGSFRPFLLLVSMFWIYVALSNVLYANNMQAGLTSMQIAKHVYASWDARLLQHLLLYPLFLLCMWASLRMGWRPLWRAVPLQSLCALGFSVLASPVLGLGEGLTSGWQHHSGGDWRTSWSSWHAFVASGEGPVWIASTVHFLVTYGFGVALVYGFAIYQRLRDSQLRSAALEQALTQAHLTALRMQLSPHTLFNLLHTIRGQITWDPPAAQAMVVQLGDLLRRLLNAGEREFSPLADELQFVTLYLELQQRRFADRLTLSLPAREQAMLAWVPSLILQPLVENAVVHGLAGHEGPVRIRVECEASAERLVLRVLNTIAPRKPTGSPGIGLTNVRERLEVQFADAAIFSAGPTADDQWLAEIRMPLLRDGPAGAAAAAAGTLA